MQVPDKSIVFPRELIIRLKNWSQAYSDKRTVCTNKSVVVPDGHIPIERVLIVPIVLRKKLIGMIAVANKATDYNDEDIELLETIADYISPILDARIHRDREEKARKEGRMACHTQEEIAERCECPRTTVETVLTEMEKFPKSSKPSADHLTDFDIPVDAKWLSR